jgi:ubiquinone/menaquinone biosynthesis C-methylase UbiE
VQDSSLLEDARAGSKGSSGAATTESKSAFGKLCVGTSPPRLLPLILPEIIGRSVLDVGCGAGILGYLIRNSWQNTEEGSVQFADFFARDPRNDEPQLLVGVDFQLDSVKRCEHHRIYDKLYLASASHLPFADKSFDTVVCVEVLEHLEKPESLMAIRELERIARRRVVITVPRESVDAHSGHDERQFLRYEGNDPRVWEWVNAERHKSSYTARELRKMGFRCGRRSPARPLLRLLGPLRRLYDNYVSPTYAIMGVKDISPTSARSEDGKIDRQPPTVTDGIADFRSDARND